MVSFIVYSCQEHECNDITCAYVIASEVFKAR